MFDGLVKLTSMANRYHCGVFEYIWWKCWKKCRIKVFKHQFIRELLNSVHISCIEGKKIHRAFSFFNIEIGNCAISNIGQWKVLFDQFFPSLLQKLSNTVAFFRKKRFLDKTWFFFEKKTKKILFQDLKKSLNNFVTFYALNFASFNVRFPIWMAENILKSAGDLVLDGPTFRIENPVIGWSSSAFHGAEHS